MLSSVRVQAPDDLICWLRVVLSASLAGASGASSDNWTPDARVCPATQSPILVSSDATAVLDISCTFSRRFHAAQLVGTGSRCWAPVVQLIKGASLSLLIKLDSPSLKLECVSSSGTTHLASDSSISGGRRDEMR